MIILNMDIIMKQPFLLNNPLLSILHVPHHSTIHDDDHDHDDVGGHNDEQMDNHIAAINNVDIPP